MKSDALAMVALALTLVSSGAEGALTRQEIARAGLAPAMGAVLPKDAVFREANGAELTLGAVLRGKPALVSFTDYTCRRVCGPALESLALALQSVSLRQGADYRVVAIGFNPANGPADAAAFRDAHFGNTDFARQTHFLTADPATIARLSQAAGLSVTYDAQHQQFAHPIGLLLTTPDGRISRIVNPLTVTPFDLRLAIVQTAESQLASISDRVTLLCYGWDAATGAYTVAIWRILTLCCLVTTALFAAAMLYLVRRDRRKATP